MKKNILSFIICFIFFAPFSILHAESEYSLRLAPVLVSPSGAEQLQTGMGVNASLDWSFFTFAEKFDLGMTFGGGFASIPVQAGNPFMLLQGKAGPFLRWRPFDRWAVQAEFNAGIYQFSRGEDSDIKGLIGGTLGAQFHLSPYFSLFSDIGYTHRVFASKPFDTFDVILGIRFNVSEIMGSKSRVDMEKTEQYRVFPVSYAWYENNPIATVTITNNEPNTITDLQLTFFMNSYMTQPWTFAVVPSLGVGESIEVPVTALFNEALINLSGIVTANGVLEMQYRSLGAKKTTVSSVQMPIFHRNNMSWDDDRRAAAFVSPRDSAARFFARHVASGIERAISSQQLSTRGIPSNVVYAAALFEALRLYRINYVVDPASSYVALSDDESEIDNLNFPYQTLSFRGGDCDDLSILLCSLLEALNIETAFITVPGHIFLAFEVGNDSWLANNANIIVHNGKRWMPLESTVPNEGFSRSWRTGVQQWQRHRNNAAVYPIHEAWQIYPSVTVPESNDFVPEVPQWDAIVRAVDRELGNLR